MSADDITHKNFTSIDINAFRDMNITEILPHSYPFLFVDRVIYINDKKTHMTAIKNITYNEEFFNGHFGKRGRILPGVISCEAIAQTALILALKFILNKTKDECNIRFLGIDNAKFRMPIFPGDRMYINTRMDRQRSEIFKFSGNIYTESGLCTECKMTAGVFLKK